MKKSIETGSYLSDPIQQVEGPVDNSLYMAYAGQSKILEARSVNF